MIHSEFTKQTMMISFNKVAVMLPSIFNAPPPPDRAGNWTTPRGPIPVHPRGHVLGVPGLDDDQLPSHYPALRPAP